MGAILRNHLKTINSKVCALLQRFRRDGRGNVAVMTGLLAVPLLAVSGIAIDYSRSSFVRSFLQAEADAAALGAAAGGQSVDDAKWVTAAQDHTKSRFSSGISNLSITGKWLTVTDFGVDASASVPVTLLAALPGYSKEMTVGVTAVARYSEPVLEYKPPTLAQLDPDAADYNRIYVYCYNPKTKKRTQEVAVADNGGTTYTYTMPLCATGENLSYRLHNVRNARTTKSKWDSSKAEHYEYYTDTVITGGAETYGLQYSLLETVLCDTKAACKYKSEGGVLPEGANRVPQKATATCSTGKYFYYGWEDRPPEQGGSDKDYNDIRIVIECPTVKSSGVNSVRLIK